MCDKGWNWDRVRNYGFIRDFARFTYVIGQFIGQFIFGEGEKFYLINDNDTVSRAPPFDFEKKAVVELFISKLADMVRFREEMVLWGSVFQRRMGCLVIGLDICQKISAELIKVREIPDIKRGHPLILYFLNH